MKTYYVENGTLFTMAHVSIEEPSIIIDGDVVVKVGSYEWLYPYYKKMLEAKLEDAVFIRFYPQKLPIEDIAYIFRRCVEFTATGFVQQLVENWGSDDFQAWLTEEKKRVPLHVYP